MTAGPNYWDAGPTRNAGRRVLSVTRMLSGAFCTWSARNVVNQISESVSNNGSSSDTNIPSWEAHMLRHSSMINKHARRSASSGAK